MFETQTRLEDKLHQQLGGGEHLGVCSGISVRPSVRPSGLLVCRSVRSPASMRLLYNRLSRRRGCYVYAGRRVASTLFPVNPPAPYVLLMVYYRRLGRRQCSVSNSWSVFDRSSRASSIDGARARSSWLCWTAHYAFI